MGPETHPAMNCINISEASVEKLLSNLKSTNPQTNEADRIPARPMTFLMVDFAPVTARG